MKYRKEILDPAILHFSNGKFEVIVEEGSAFAEHTLETEQLAAVLNRVSGSKSFRLLSCNDIAAAQELSAQLKGKSLYASHGWVDLYTDGVIQSQNNFQKIVNGEVLSEVKMNRKSVKYLELKNKVLTDFGKNLDDYDMFNQVQLKYSGDDYFVADQLFVKRDALGEIDDIIIVENKLSSATPLTGPQVSALQSTKYIVRSRDIESQFNRGLFLRKESVLEFYSLKQWYKVYDGTTGNEIIGIQKVQ